MTSAATYKNAEETFDALTSGIDDNDMYRLANLSKYGRCDASQFDYAGIANYTSTENASAMDLAKTFGAEHYAAWAEYNKNMPESSEDFLGFRYFLSKIPLDGKSYEAVGQSGETVLYKNENALPLIYPAASEAKNLDAVGNSFEFMNRFWRSLSDPGYGDVFTVFIPLIHQEPTDKGTDVTLTLNPPSKGNLYLQVPSYLNMKIESDDGEQTAFSSYQDIYYLGAADSSKVITLHVKGNINISKIFCAVEHTDVAQEYINDAMDAAPQVIEHTSSHLSFDNKTEGETMYASSIPFDAQWHVSADGNEIAPQDNGGFLAFQIPAGTRAVELEYVPKGMRMGYVISIVSLAVLLAAAVTKQLYPKAAVERCGNEESLH